MQQQQLWQGAVRKNQQRELSWSAPAAEATPTSRTCVLLLL